MRILFISNYYPPYEVGGYEQLCQEVASRLTERGHQVAVLTSRPEPRGKPVVEDNVYRVLTLEVDWRLPVSAWQQFFFGRKRREAENLEWFDRVVAESDPQVILVWNARELHRSLLQQAENLPSAGVVYWLAGYSPAEPDQFTCYWQSRAQKGYKTWPKKLVGALALRMLAAEGRPVRLRLEHVLCVSAAFRDSQVQAGLLPPHSRVVYNGIDLEQFPFCVRHDRAPQDGEPLRLLYAGRLAPEKGVHTAIEAVGHLVRQVGLQNVYLLVVGSGPQPYRDRLADLRCSLHLEEQVEFRDWVSREEMPGLMRQFDVLVLPSIYDEPLARIVQEAMATGLVVVGTLTGGTKEILVDEVNGLAFPPGDASALAAQIARLAGDPGLRLALAQNGRCTVEEKFSLTRMVDEMEGYFRDIMRDNIPVAGKR